MKTTLIAGAALAALLSAPAFAETVPSGHVGTSYSNVQVDVGANDDEADAWAVDGAVVWNLGEGSLGVQLDGAYTNIDDSDALGANAHLFSRNDSYLLGGFVGLADTEGSDTSWIVGAEAQKYLNDVTLAGVLAYGDSSDNDGDGVWGVGGELRYFVNDNVRLSGGLGYADSDVDQVVTLGLGGEYQFAASPISLYANYARGEFDDADLTTDTFTVGVRYDFGGTTLKSRDRQGASLTGASTVFGGLF